MNPSNRRDVLKAVMGQVAADAERRAADLRKFVNGLDQVSDFQWAALEQDREYAVMFAGQMQEQVDAVLHVHTGSSDAMHARRAASHVLALAAGTAGL